MLTAEENDLLTRVEGDAPMGHLMRQHWTPVCLVEEVGEPDGTPLLVEALGQRMVAFRDTEGRLGLLNEKCPHRKASLLLGRNEECGLRCLYHGWKYAVDGRCVSMHTEPEDSGLLGKVRARAWPVVEWAGLVWAWLGESEAAPPFDPPAFAPRDDIAIAILKIRVPCNWAQIHEGQIDSAHSSSLHANDMVPARVTRAEADEKSWYRPSTDRSPRLQVERTDYGFHYVAIRRPIRRAATHAYLRVTEFIAPYTSLIPPNNRFRVASVIVPIDDVNSFFYFIAWDGPEVPSTEEWRAYHRTRRGVDLTDDWAPRGTLENRFLQDREAMRTDSFTGIRGIPNQDVSMWVSPGRIVDRTDDILGASDLAVVEFRRLMVEAARAVARGEPAIGTSEARMPQASIRSLEGVYSKEEDWRELNTAGRHRQPY
ncbi:MAG: Rieske 2Fe-2S domain-containing protein [Rhodospirillaceae bacterium]|nr:Rieske 2Fe-2S domain-containing protein [Rhodospirillaceae bacterium]